MPPDPGADQTRLHRTADPENQISSYFSDITLAQTLGNLLDNAIKYTPASGVISLTVSRRASGTEVTVSDSGPGVPEAERQRVLERFVRLDRSRHLPGNGLGLALVAAVARLHQAELILADAHPGLVVALRFPRSSAIETLAAP